MAFTVNVPAYVIEASIDCCNAVNMGNRGDGFDGTFDQQLVGTIGQNMVNLAIGKPLIEPTIGHDGGVDFELFGITFDVKTIGRNVAPRIDFVNNLVKSQTKFSVDAYLFLSFNKSSNRITVCGWLPKMELLDRATLYRKGTQRVRDDDSVFTIKADNYEICNDQLFYQAKCWPDLFVEFYNYSNLEVAA